MSIITKLPKKGMNTQHVNQVSSVRDYSGYRMTLIFIQIKKPKHFNLITSTNIKKFIPNNYNCNIGY